MLSFTVRTGQYTVRFTPAPLDPTSPTSFQPPETRHLTVDERAVRIVSFSCFLELSVSSWSWPSALTWMSITSHGIANGIVFYKNNILLAHTFEKGRGTLSMAFIWGWRRVRKQDGAALDVTGFIMLTNNREYILLS